MESTKFLYIRDDTNFPVACVAFKHEIGSIILYASMSVRNPKDKLSKEFGRELAKKRLGMAPLKIQVEKDCGLHDLVRTIITNVADGTIQSLRGIRSVQPKRIPKRVVKAAQFMREQMKEEDEKHKGGL